MYEEGGGVMRRPAFVTERKTPAPYDDCTLASGAMGVDFATAGAITPTRAEMRAHCGVPDTAASDPTNLWDVQRAVAALAPDVQMVIPQTGIAWGLLAGFLDQGWGAVLQGRNSALPAHFRRWDDYAGGHAVWVQAHSASALWWMDPLAPAGWTGEPIARSTARTWAESWRNPPMAGLFPPHRQEVDTMILAGGLGLRSDCILPLSAGTRIYREPDGDQFYHVSADVRPAFIGNADGWRAVLFNTSHFQPDKKQRPTVLYVRAADAGAPERVPAGDDAGALQREVQAWLADCPVPLPK